MTVRRLVPLAIIATLASLAGCHPQRDARPPLVAPPAIVRVDHFAGTALSGPQSGASAIVDPWGVQARVIAIDTTTPVGFARVGPAARLVLGPETGTVIAPSARLIYATLIRSLAPGEDLALGDAHAQSSIAAPDAAVVAGATASITIAQPDVAPRTAGYPRRSVRISVSRRAAGDDAYDVAIVSDDLVFAPAAAAPSRPGRATASARRPPPATQVASTSASEVIVVERKRVAGVDRFALAIPMAFPNSPATCVVVDVTVGAAPTDAALSMLKAQLDASAAAVIASRTSAAPSPEALAIDRALEGLGAAGTSPRGTLTFIAGRTGARLAESVALVADDSLLQLIAGQAQQRLARLASRDARSIAWLLDRTTIDALASVSEADAPRVLPPVQGALSIYAGEAGRQLDVLRSIAGESTSSDDLFSRIVAENTIVLEESSPGLRVRAADWLRANGRAPAGFDPLGTPQQRRAALERAREPTTIPTTNP